MKDLFKPTTLIKTLLFMLTIVSCQHNKTVEYIFPENYKGWAIIIYTGNKALDNTKIRIPKNGIAYVPYNRPSNSTKIQYLISQGNELHKVYPSFDLLSKDDTLSTYLLSNIDYSFSFKKSNEWIVYDNVVVLKISHGLKDTTAYKEDFDEYIRTIRFTE